MKHKTTRYVSECDTCRKVKADYMKPGVLLQPLSILEWRWDDISMGRWDDINMDFIVGLPLTARKFDSVWVIMDQLSKSAHFIPIHTNYNVHNLSLAFGSNCMCPSGLA
jgi:hypothetical protein